MATGKRTTKPKTLVGLLIAAGCEFCPTCFAYVTPGHSLCVLGASMRDVHESRYAIVGIYRGSSEDLRLADLTADTQEVA